MLKRLATYAIRARMATDPDIPAAMGPKEPFLTFLTFLLDRMVDYTFSTLSRMEFPAEKDAHTHVCEGDVEMANALDGPSEEELNQDMAWEYTRAFCLKHFGYMGPSASEAAMQPFQ